MSPSASQSPSASVSPSHSTSPSSSASPSGDASLLLDLEADAGLGLSDNDPVALWVNQNGSGNDATGNTQKPTFKATAGPGGRPTVRFGSQMTLDSSIAIGSACTIFCVLKPTASQIGTVIGGTIGCVQYRVNGLKMNLVKQELVDIATSSTNLSTSAFQQVNMTWDGTTATFRLGGAADGNTSNAQTISVASIDIGQAASQAITADICMLKIYNRVLSGAEIAAEEAAITTRWGV